MANKTVPTDQDPLAYLNALEDEGRRQDCLQLVQIMEEEVGAHPVMWGDAIVGFGTYRYVYQSGREGDWPLVGFSPRKRNLSLYIMSGFEGADDLMARLGKHKTGKSCLYINKLADIDQDALRELIRRSLAFMRQTYTTSLD
ncbi:DUF1801 domain-containing protein [Lujinxingia litoralis]|uniref:DUF1801 domain-containing protein n=1 Tax=Lujinxingia litoralis TaxID=2211119 RepID=A0A328CBX6_9DELT|nr:DUF1801 domain-containing protein [Lujinxingia litoralis]RAL25176.1 DUF1801 domain-containing protein [Lujinxingia litoralis]